MVNDTALTIAEVLYPLRQDFAKLAEAGDRARLRPQCGQLIRQQVQRDVGSILVYRSARAALDESRVKIVEDTVQRALTERAAREFGGSLSRLEEHLAAHGLTRAQYQKQIERDMLVRQYGKERFLPQIHVTRADLLREYERNREKYSTVETRELFLIEAPFAAFVPRTTRWEAATERVRGETRAQTAAHIRAAHAALATRPFEQVAREYSKGAAAANGGAWGAIAKPLQPPLSEVSRRVFALGAGQYTEPIETERGWYIARCGAITPAKTRGFGEVQDELREALKDQRFTQVTMQHIMKLAESATISNLESFVEAAARQAEQRCLTPIAARP